MENQDREQLGDGAEDIPPQRGVPQATTVTPTVAEMRRRVRGRHSDETGIARRDEPHEAAVAENNRSGSHHNPVLEAFSAGSPSWRGTNYAACSEPEG